MEELIEMMDVQFWNAGTRMVSEVARVSGVIRGNRVKGPIRVMTYRLY